MSIDLEAAAAKYIGQLSNGNVTVSRKWNTTGTTPDCVVATCWKCGLFDTIVITPNCGPFTNDAVEEFCKNHRHEESKKDKDASDMGIGGGLGYQIKYTSSGPQSVDQDTILAIAKLSNFNVTQQARKSGFEYRYRLLCNSCHKEMTIGRIISKSEVEAEGTEYFKFCQEHAHRQTAVAASTGRKFREE